MTISTRLDPAALDRDVADSGAHDRPRAQRAGRATNGDAIELIRYVDDHALIARSKRADIASLGFGIDERLGTPPLVVPGADCVS